MKKHVIICVGIRFMRLFNLNFVFILLYLHKFAQVYNLYYTLYMYGNIQLITNARGLFMKYMKMFTSKHFYQNKYTYTYSEFYLSLN